VQVIRDQPRIVSCVSFWGWSIFTTVFCHMQQISFTHSILTVVTSRTQALTWTDEAQAAFQAVKEALADATLLSHPLPLSPSAIVSDASNIAIGAVLQQQIDGHWHPISYFSKKTISTRNTIQRI
jgi:hypothetical protein